MQGIWGSNVCREYGGLMYVGNTEGQCREYGGPMYVGIWWSHVGNMGVSCREYGGPM